MSDRRRRGSHHRRRRGRSECRAIDVAARRRARGRRGQWGDRRGCDNRGPCRIRREIGRDDALPFGRNPHGPMRRPFFVHHVHIVGGRTIAVPLDFANRNCLNRPKRPEIRVTNAVRLRGDNPVKAWRQYPAQRLMIAALQRPDRGLDLRRSCRLRMGAPRSRRCKRRKGRAIGSCEGSLASPHYTTDVTVGVRATQQSASVRSSSPGLRTHTRTGRVGRRCYREVSIKLHVLVGST